jgi:hypothetical protein
MPIVNSLKVLNDLETRGVSRIEFCSSEIIDQLRLEFNRLHPTWNDTMKNGYYFSIYGGDQEYRRAVHNTLLPILKPALDQVFQNYRVLALIGQVKGVGDSSIVGIHQDLTVVDESKFRSYTLWIPLQDSTNENGPLSFLEYSQHAFRNIRCHSIEYLFANVEEYIISHSKTYLANKGEALIFDTATIHHSSPNLSELPRISLGISIIDSKVSTEIHYFDKSKPFDGTLDKYSVPLDFWHLYDDFEKERLCPPSFGLKIGRSHGAQVLPYDRDTFIKKYEETA